jgi:hypothetical protein
MTVHEAKRVLLSYRPGSSDDQDPEVAQALGVVNTDPDLRLWFEGHCAFQTAMRSRLREMPVPAHLKQALLARHKIVPLPHTQRGRERTDRWWQSVPAMAAAAAVTGRITDVRRLLAG